MTGNPSPLNKMKLAIGSDHAGFKLKSTLLDWLRTPAAGKNQLLDFGTTSEESTDYPDFAKDVALAVSHKRATKGILFCGTGTGMAIAANKVHGIRAAVAWAPEIASLASEHNNANILCLPARFMKTSMAKQIIGSFLKTPFGGGRHARRVRKMMAIEKCT